MGTISPGLRLSSLDTVSSEPQNSAIDMPRPCHPVAILSSKNMPPLTLWPTEVALGAEDIAIKVCDPLPST